MLYIRGHESEGEGYFEIDTDNDHGGGYEGQRNKEKCVQCEGDKGVPYEKAYGKGTPVKIFETRICTDHYYKSTLETHPLFSHLARTVTILPLKEYRKYKWLKYRIPNRMFKLEGFAQNLR
jgi:hypothetical protein